MNDLPIKSILTPSEMLQAAIWGSMRNIQSWKKATDKYGACTDKDGWQLNIMAVMAEIAWAKHKKLYYNAAIGDYQSADVADWYQIRCSSIAYKENACLRIHEEDVDDKPYILALVGMGKIEFIGWIYGSEGKKDRYWGDKWKVNRPAYFIPQEDLKPMQSLS